MVPDWAPSRHCERNYAMTIGSEAIGTPAKRYNLYAMAFLTGYVLLIISTLDSVRADSQLADALLVGRIGAYLVIAMTWVSRFAAHPKRNLGFAILLLGFSPYLLTSGYMVYVDTAVVLIIASALGRSERDARKFFVLAAFASAILVSVFAVLAFLGLLPTVIFEWGDRAKNSMGFLNPNTFYYYLFSSAFVFFVWRRAAGFVLIGVVMAAFYSLVESRTFLLAYLLLAFYWALGRFLNRCIRLTLLWVWFGIAVVFGVMTAIFPVQVLAGTSLLFGIDLNDVLSNRFDVISSEAADGVTTAVLVGGRANYADSLYVYWINGVGIVLFTLLMLVVAYVIAERERRFGEKLLVSACVYFTVGCFEVPYGGSSLVALLLVWMLFFQNKYSAVEIERFDENINQTQAT